MNNFKETFYKNMAINGTKNIYAEMIIDLFEEEPAMVAEAWDKANPNAKVFSQEMIMTYDVLKLIEEWQGRKIPVIKYIRHKYIEDLKAAKNFVEKVLKDHNYIANSQGVWIKSE
jgi:ribosomal protein L7/L12